ncbi:uncharacterized protein BT62DRAFT_935946 [Guyanagaster necrorhizus]|uniref:Uncharacterized protein n=1 Tax=Guyanagaster necrorhizus TaxID=856835 RepID=A0A9P7VLB8_9AGAR|nr:uncharacterized protein BT62DRAFT_935946 [Guyanagaster necrorhizus MCA 3950]KAG7442645.1 hypothetical protein BT62DRAFT_935946 [Guyanagaster necrorhizus MCA 3950]
MPTLWRENPTGGLKVRALVPIRYQECTRPANTSSSRDLVPVPYSESGEATLPAMKTSWESNALTWWILLNSGHLKRLLFVSPTQPTTNQYRHVNNGERRTDGGMLSTYSADSTCSGTTRAQLYA